MHTLLFSGFGSAKIIEMGKVMTELQSAVYCYISVSYTHLTLPTNREV